MSTEKALWQIVGTEHVSANKEALKKIRDQLNTQSLKLEEGKTLATILAQQWPFHITKGPDHPKRTA